MLSFCSYRSLCHGPRGVLCGLLAAQLRRESADEARSLILWEHNSLECNGFRWWVVPVRPFCGSGILCWWGTYLVGEGCAGSSSALLVSRSGILARASSPFSVFSTCWIWQQSRAILGVWLSRLGGYTRGGSRLWLEIWEGNQGPVIPGGCRL